MRWKNLSEERLRIGVALSVTLAAHVTAYYVLSIDLRTPRRASLNGPPALAITIFIPEARLEKPKRARAGAQESARSAAPEHSSRAVSNAPLPEAQPLTALDWNEAGSVSAVAAFNRSINPEHRSLDSKPKTIPKPEVYEKGLFDLGPAHKPGTVENFGEGIVRTWVSAYCYELNPMAYAGLGGSPPLFPTCLRSEASYGGGDLFESLTPKYLRR
jgi:hypothetical protein